MKPYDGLREGDRTPKATPAEALTFLMNKEK